MPSGRLDGIHEGELYGWAFDSDQPQRSLKVTIHVNGRPMAETLAVYYRPDVAELLNCSGQHGFYLGLNRDLHLTGRVVVDVRLPDGSFLPGSPLQVQIPSQPLTRQPTLLFMHLAKTAGTSLRESVLQNYRQSEILYIYPDPPGFPVGSLHELPLEQRARCRVVVGHFQYGVHEFIPNECLYFTIARHPIQRVYSHYAHLVRQKNPATRQNGRVRSLAELLESRATVDLDNLMVRCFAGIDERDFPPGTLNQEVYDLAEHHLTHAFAHVGYQEKLDEAFAWLQAKLGAHPASDLARINCTEEDKTSCEDGLIRHFYYWDCMFYQRIQQLFP